MPLIADDLTHWNDIFTWRQHHYQLLSESTAGSNAIVANLGSQASAQTLIKFGKVARKHNLLSVAQKSIQGIETVSSVSDCFQKIVQNVKCSIQLAQCSENSQNDLTEALKSLELVNIEIFSAEQKAELTAYKGYL